MVNSGDTAWVLISTALVMLMTIPGLALFYGGMSNSIPRVFTVARQYKGFGAVTIAGGSHVDALPQEALQSSIDIVVHGEGEETISELLDVRLFKGENCKWI